MKKEDEEKEILKSFKKLKKSCKHCSIEENLLLDQAFEYARSVYGESRTKSGELRIVQTIKVSIIVAKEIGLKMASIIAALLHDIINNPDENLKEVESRFGTDISNIIRGFKKISGFHSDKVSLQSENFRSLFLNTVDDVRIIFIKMAHRLYDMRIYHQLPKQLQKWFLDDVKYLYIPIAHRLGLYQIKAELEDFEFKYSSPKDYEQIKSRLNETQQEQKKYIHKFIQPIREILGKNYLEFEIKSRAKTISSIKKKMIKQRVDIDQVYDLFAIRVIITNTLSDEEINFVEEYQNYVNKYGDPRINQTEKINGNNQSIHGESNEESEEEILKKLRLEEKIREEKLAAFEEKRKQYLELMHDEKTACWKTYSLITNIYQPNPKRLRDWISAPKDSGYESLHTTVLGPENRHVEVQIRTKRMDEHAEKGSAAHWRYKESAYGKDVDSWMNDIRNVLESMGAQQLDEGGTSKIQSDSDKIYVFTPEGDLRELRKGATVLDFAFEIHTRLGSQCSGGKVNNKLVPIRQKLQNGDRVEILSSKKQKPNIDWLNYVVTSKAKSRINRTLREEKFQEAERERETLMRKFKNWKIEFSDRNINKIIKHFSLKNPVDLYLNLAGGELDIKDIKKLFLTPEEIEEKVDNTASPFQLQDELLESQSEKDQEYIIIDAGISNLNYSLAKCCSPIAGDHIFGFVTVNSGIKVHRLSCPNSRQLMDKFPYRIIKCRWKESKEMHFFNSNLRIVGKDRMGIISDITKVISNDLKVNMRGIRLKSIGDDFEGNIKVQVRDAEHLGFLRLKLLKIKDIKKVVRYDYDYDPDDEENFE